VKVLLVDLETEWRGGQNQAWLLLKGLRDRGHEAELVTIERSALAERVRAAGITVHSSAVGFFRIPAARNIRGLLRSGNFDLVHANEAHAVTAVWLALVAQRKSLRVPFVISRRVGYPIGKNAIAQARYRAAARIVAISRWSAERVLRSGIPANKVTIVYEGVELPAPLSAQRRADARSRFGIAQGEPVLGCVGALSPDKGQEWLIRALAPLRKKSPSAKLLLAGTGPCRERLQKLAREAGVGDAVIFAGFISDVESVYAAVDVFLLPSFFEALSNALMSAMAYAVPSIAFNVGGPAEIIEDGKSGLLVEPANVEALYTASAKILDDAAFASRVGKNGRRHIEQAFSDTKMVGEMLRVYEECLKKG
jgi:glycosyltransferase involved in cell wall biosynthesis